MDNLQLGEIVLTEPDMAEQERLEREGYRMTMRCSACKGDWIEQSHAACVSNGARMEMAFSRDVEYTRTRIEWGDQFMGTWEPPSTWEKIVSESRNNVWLASLVAAGRRHGHGRIVPIPDVETLLQVVLALALEHGRWLDERIKAAERSMPGMVLKVDKLAFMTRRKTRLGRFLQGAAEFFG